MDPQMEALLQLMDQPVFLVRENRIFWHNHAAGELVTPGQTLDTLPGWATELYDLWDRQSVIDTELTLEGQSYSVKIRNCETGEIFVLKRKNGELPLEGDAVPHTSGQLRRILQELVPACMILQDHMDDREDLLDEAARVNHSIYRLLRLCNKLSREERFFYDTVEPYLVWTDLRRFVTDFVHEVGPILEESERKLILGPMNTALHANIDREMIRSALYYLLSHGLLHSPRGSELLLKNWEDSKGIFFSLTYTETGNPGLRGPEREDTDLARVIASFHGGALFRFSEEDDKVRLVLSIRKLPGTLPLKERRLFTDLYGNFHPGLVELSDGLEAEMYHPDRV